ncbi:MAG: hypothetical protein IPN16_13360 [Gemmatimonadetes bacterium]|nr:hypothetical protein [Gemmatimonadota bacterium]
MNVWSIEPHDTLVLRDGRELEGTSTPIRSMELPWPSTIAGFARSRGWSPPTQSADDVARHANDLLRQVSVGGPWLAVRDERGTVIDLAVPAPQDCVWHRHSGGPLERRRLVPRDRAALGECDLPPALSVLDFGESVSVPAAKPIASPAFWYWSDVRSWLEQPESIATVEDTFGMPPLVHESRMHVSLHPDSYTAIEGMLFRTDHVRYRVSAARRASIVFTAEGLDLGSGSAFVGGERRISTLQRLELPDALRFELPPEQTFGGSTRLRVLLLTPAWFSEGAVPAMLHGAKVVAAAVGRPKVVSGWDFLNKQPKHSRRLAPAGSVYWLELPSGAADHFVQQHWLRSVCSDEQDKRDGYGIAVMGVA